jgi:hypothetical protein
MRDAPLLEAVVRQQSNELQMVRWIANASLWASSNLPRNIIGA